MKILVFNDPHRGFSTNTSKIQDEIFESIDQDSFDLVLVCGDWGTTKTDHVRGAFKAFRRAFPEKPILGVLGNHDYWDPRDSIVTIDQNIKRYAAENNIHLLEKNPYETEDVLFLGFNGWFFHQDPQQDRSFDDFLIRRKTRIRPNVGGKKTDFYFREKSEEGLDFILKQDLSKKTVVVVSHFPCVKEIFGDQELHCGNPDHGEKLLGKVDYLLFGHTHEKVDEEIKGTRVINVGSGYKEEDLKIKEHFLYQIIEVNKKEKK